MKKRTVRDFLFVYDTILVLLIVIAFFSTGEWIKAAGVGSFFITTSTAIILIALLFYYKVYLYEKVRREKRDKKLKTKIKHLKKSRKTVKHA